MMIFNYKGLAFDRSSGENFDVMHFSFLDYNQSIREINLVWTSVGRKSIWLAQFSGLTTEYSGSLGEVLDKVNQHYISNCYKAKDDE